MSKEVNITKEATPNGIRETMLAEYQKKGEVTALMSQYFIDFAEGRGYDSVIEMFREDPKSVNTARLELYEPFKVEGYDCKGTLEKAMYDKIAKRFNRYKTGVLAMIAAEELPEAETTDGEEPETPEEEEEEEEYGAECGISKTEDELYAKFITDLNSAMTSYLSATEMTDKMEEVAKAAILHIKAEWLSN